MEQNQTKNPATDTTTQENRETITLSGRNQTEKEANPSRVKEAARWLPGVGMGGQAGGTAKGHGTLRG